jgi:hypothetical protein
MRILLFSSLTFKSPKKRFFSQVYAIKPKRSHKTVEIKVFLLFFFFLIEGSGSGAVQINYGSGCGSRSPKNMCPDPDHCFPEHPQDIFCSDFIIIISFQVTVVGIDGRMVYESLVLPENEIIGMHHLILLRSSYQYSIASPRQKISATSTATGKRF